MVRLEEHKGGAISPLLDNISISDVARSGRPREDGHEEYVSAIDEGVTVWVQLRRGDVDVLQHIPKKQIERWHTANPAHEFIACCVSDWGQVWPVVPRWNQYVVKRYSMDGAYSPERNFIDF